MRGSTYELEGPCVDVLVIGGNRFVGWLLGFRLLAAGHKVTLLNRGRLADPFGGRVDRIVATGPRAISSAS